MHDPAKIGSVRSSTFQQTDLRFSTDLILTVRQAIRVVELHVGLSATTAAAASVNGV